MLQLDVQKIIRRTYRLHYLERDASNWWVSLEPKYGDTNPTWLSFRHEFEKKYFPSEAKSNQSVREYEAKFTRLHRYVRYGRDDDDAMIHTFLRGLRPELRSRL